MNINKKEFHRNAIILYILIGIIPESDQLMCNEYCLYVHHTLWNPYESLINMSQVAKIGIKITLEV